MDQNLHWVVYDCIVPILQQGALISGPLLISGIIVRLCVLLKFPSSIIHLLVAIMGLYMLWFFYLKGMIFFVVLCGIIYVVLLTVQRYKGVIVGGIALAFLLIWYVI